MFSSNSKSKIEHSIYLFIKHALRYLVVFIHCVKVCAYTIFAEMILCKQKHSLYFKSDKTSSIKTLFLFLYISLDKDTPSTIINVSDTI